VTDQPQRSLNQIHNAAQRRCETPNVDDVGCNRVNWSSSFPQPNFSAGTEGRNLSNRTPSASL
jgi:hypothetical protein